MTGFGTYKTVVRTRRITIAGTVAQKTIVLARCVPISGVGAQKAVEATPRIS
jgi:hypothetical protein